MRLIRLALEALSEGEQRVTGDVAHYALRVHRLAVGDAFVAFDPRACLEADAVVITTARDAFVCRLGAARPGRRAELGARLLQCIGKGDKMDEVVRAATALGASAIVACESERSVVKLGERGAARRARWWGVALDAARQSGRGDLPDVAGPLSLAEALSLEARRPELKCCLVPRAERAFGALLATSPEREVALLVGPEGGLSGEEIALAEASGFVPVSFGPFDLRTEIAGVAALGALLARHQRG